jgi:16S rRNA (guanine527-N7)-methyltransferase
MPEANLSLLTETAAAWELVLPAALSEQVLTYAAELQRWNQHTNLTAITETNQIIVRHFLDSFACALHWGEPPRTLVDVGSGAGFPGLALKLLYPDLHVTLIESVGKKTAFLHHIVNLLGLTNVTILTARAEAVGRTRQQRATYDVATARALAELRILVEYAIPLLRVGGRLLAPKGAGVEAEVDAAQHALGLLGGHVRSIEPISLPGVDPRSLVVIAKTVPTPDAYPRGVGVPARRPL